MSLDDTMSTHDAGHDHGHHDSPEVVDSRERFGLWLFIAGDALTLAAIWFTYLYLRGTDTGGHWMSMLGYQGHSYAWYENALNSSSGLPAPTLIHVGPMSAGLIWLVTLVVAVSAAVIWWAEKLLRETKNAKAFSNVALLGTVVVVLAVILSIVQLRHIPSIFVANNDSQVMAYTGYSSAMMIIIAAALFHFVILAFLGLGLAIRAARGAITGEKWYQARLVRIFWVWVAVSAVLTSLLTVMVNKL